MASQLVQSYSFDVHVVECRCRAGDAGVTSLCDVALKGEDVAPSGYAVDRATVRQKKTGQPVRFELTEQRDDKDHKRN